jgi:hypothetical protein
MNNKGEFHLSYWWIFCWVFVVLALISGTIIFFGTPTDIRRAESAVLANKISRCIFEQGTFDLDELKNMDFYTICGLNKKSFEGESYYFAYFSILDSSNHKQFEFNVGKSSMFDDCMAIGKEIEGEYYPRCTYKNESITYINNDELKEGTLEIITASNQYYASKKQEAANG